MKYIFCIPYMGQFHNEVMRIGHSARFDDFLFCHILVAIANVLLDGGLKEDGFLTHDADVLTKPLDVVVANIFAVDQDLRKIHKICFNQYVLYVILIKHQN